MEGQVSLGGSSQDEVASVVQANKGDIVVGGSSTSADGDVTGNQGYDDYWVIRLEPAEFDNQRGSENASNYSSLKESAVDHGFAIFPTITSSSFTVQLQTQTGVTSGILEIINPMGKIISGRQITVSNGILKTAINFDAAVPKGLYFIQLKMGDHEYSGMVYYQ